MRRTLSVLTILLVGLVTACGVSAGPQSKNLGTLSGVVLGPDDKPVPRASIMYQSGGGNAPHAVRADSHGRFTIGKLKADNYQCEAGANHDVDAAADLRQANSQSVREEQAAAIIHILY